MYSISNLHNPQLFLPQYQGTCFCIRLIMAYFCKFYVRCLSNSFSCFLGVFPCDNLPTSKAIFHRYRIWADIHSLLHATSSAAYCWSIWVLPHAVTWSYTYVVFVLFVNSASLSFFTYFLCHFYHFPNLPLPFSTFVLLWLLSLSPCCPASLLSFVTFLFRHVCPLMVHR